MLYLLIIIIMIIIISYYTACVILADSGWIMLVLSANVKNIHLYGGLSPKCCHFPMISVYLS